MPKPARWAKAEMATLLRDGGSIWPEIAKQLGVSTGTAQRYVRWFRETRTQDAQVDELDRAASPSPARRRPEPTLGYATAYGIRYCQACSNPYASDRCFTCEQRPARTFAFLQSISRGGGI
jgi:hypothetical protein